MRRNKFAFLFALMTLLFCGASFASELADDMTIAGNFARGYTVNNWYSESVTVSGGTQDYTFNITEGGLPPGFFIRQSGTYFYLEGIPNTAGTWKFTLRVTDRRDMYAERKLSVTIDDTNYKADDMTLSGAFTASGETGKWYESRIYTEGGTQGYTFNVTGTLPPGLYIYKYGSDFYLQGVPTQTGDYTFTLKVTDRRNSYAEISSTVSITAGDSYKDPSEAEDMAITGDLPTGRRINESYSGSVSLTGYDDSTVWSIVDGSLPPGLSLSGGRYGCDIRGIPNTGGTYRFTLRATASRNVYVERQFVIKINASPFEAEDMSITDNFTTNKMINESYSSYVHLNGYTDNVTWTLAEGTLPPGLSLRSGNYYIELYGIPNTGGTYTFTLRATDSRNSYVERPFTVKINDTPFEAEDMSITGDFTTGTRINDSYYGQVNVNGYEGNVYWTLADGALPDGLSLRPSGSTAYIRGIPNKGGTYTFTLRATDSRNAYIERQFLIKINDTPYKDDGMSITGDFDTGKNVSESYYSYVFASSYAGSIYWTHVSGALPDGLSLRPDGRYAYIRGIPNKPGTYKFTLRATDTRNAYTEREFSITINGDEPSAPSSTDDMILSGAFPDGYTINNWYSSYIQASGGESDYTFKITGGTLPPGFYIRQDGSYFYLEGIPNTAGTYTFKLRVIDSRKTYAEREFTVKINSSHYVTTDMSLSGKFPDAYTINPWYSNYIQANGGEGDYTFNITAGSLPPGFFIRQNGSYFYLEGIPSAPGTYTFSLRVTDRRNAYTERSFTINIKGSAAPAPDPEDPVTIITSSLPNGKEGEAYSASISVTADTSTGLTWVITGLPDGLSYTTNGKTCTISGKPTAAGTYTVKVNVANTETEDTKEFTLTVEEPDEEEDTITITTSSLAVASTGESYSQTLKAEGTVTSWKITGGDLPEGLTLDESTGTISGTVSENAIEHNADELKDYTFEVTASNSSSSTVKKLTISVLEPIKFITDSALPNAKVGEEYKAVISVSGTMRVNVTWIVVNLPAGIEPLMPEGLSYTTNGRTCTISGTPEKAGNYVLKVDAGTIDTEDSRNFTLTVEAAPEPVEISTSSLEAAATGKEYTQTLSALGSPTSWKVTSGNLPEGLALNESTGTISGKVSENILTKHEGKNYYPSKEYSFNVTASNASGGSDSETFSITVYVPARIITESLPNAVEDKEYSTEIEGTGTGNPLTFMILTNKNDMPSGLEWTYNEKGNIQLTGTPKYEGTYRIRVAIGNIYSEEEKYLTLTVEAKPTPSLKPQISVPKSSKAYAGKDYTMQFGVTGTTPITWEISGNVPPGLTFDTSSGKLSGTVEAVDEGKNAHVHLSYNFTVTAKNRGGTDSANVFISVWYLPEITTGSNLPEAELNAGYNQEITAAGTEFTMAWKKLSGSLPKGLTLTMRKNKRTCAITGSPTETGTFTFTLELSNEVGLPYSTVTKTFTLTVKNPDETGTGKPEITTETLPNGETGAAYIAMLEASGQKPITWSKSGKFPSGLKLDKYGTIVGLPKKAGVYNFTVTASNKINKKTVKTSKAFTIIITGETYKKPSINSVKAPAAIVNQPYSLQLSAKGTNTEACPITWSFANEKYPAGLYITEDGLITGTPKEAGKFSVKVKAENNIGSAAKSITIKVDGEEPEIMNEELSDGTIKTAYSEELIANGTAPITWTKSGKFPSGLKLNKKTGAITGSPTKAGTFTFKITAKNKYGKDVQMFTIYVGSVIASALPENEPAETKPLAEIAQNDSEPETQNYAVPDETKQTGIDPGIEAHNSEIDLCVVSGDEELRGEIYAPEGQPLTFRIGTWPGVNDSDIEIFIADEAIALEVDDDTFIVPGELVRDEFVIYAKANGMKTIELYVVAEEEEEEQQ